MKMSTLVVNHHWVDNDLPNSQPSLEEFIPEEFDELPSFLNNNSLSYDPYELCKGHAFIITGMTKTGKTHLVKLLVRRNAMLFNRIFWWSPTANLQNLDFLPRKSIRNEITETALNSLLNGQEKAPYISTLLVLDDVVGSLNMNSKIIERLATSPRHYGLTLILVSQNLKKIPVTLRDNAVSIFTAALKEHQITTMHELQSNFKSVNELKDYLSKYTNGIGKFIRFNLTGDVLVKSHPLQTYDCGKFKILF